MGVTQLGLQTCPSGGNCVSTFAYIKAVIRDIQVASITPTSGAGVEFVCRPIDFGKRNVIVEYGPGTGVFTDYLLPRVSADSKIVLIERNPDFVKILREKYQDPRVRIYHALADEVIPTLQDSGESHADYILSGIPFSLFSDKYRDKVVSTTYEAIAPNGKFLPYQFFVQRDRQLKHFLNRYFPHVESGYFLRNIPPMRVYVAAK
jgi:phosphatidylethanolamine/phosphatidyl-N-methylethanolamine N-methyltransferase